MRSMNRLHIIVVGLLLCLVACNSKPELERPLVSINDEDISYVSDSLVQDIIDSVSFIPLEESTEILLGDIRKIQKENNEFFVMAEGSNRMPEVYRFSQDGHFLNKIGRLGNSRSEYVRIGSFFVLDDKVYVADLNKNRILIYHINGEFVDCNENNENIKFLHDMIAIDHNKALFSYDINFSDDNSLYEIVDLNTFNRIHSISTVYKAVGSFPFSMKEINFDGENLLLSFPFDNCIYTLDKETFTLNKILSPALWGTIPSFKVNDYDEIQKILEETEINLLCGFYVSNKKILLNSIQGSILWYSDLGKGVCLKDEVDMGKMKQFPFLPLSVCYADQEGFYSVFSGDSFTSILQKASPVVLKSNLFFDKINPEHEYANPVIVEYKIKSL